jgi:hypothetical protein
MPIWWIMFDQLHLSIDLVTEVFSQFGSVEVSALNRKCITPEMLHSVPKPYIIEKTLVLGAVDKDTLLEGLE